MILPLLPASSPCSAPSFPPRPEAHIPLEDQTISHLCSLAHSVPSAMTACPQLGLPGDPSSFVHALTRNFVCEDRPVSLSFPSAHLSSPLPSRSCHTAHAGHIRARAHAVTAYARISLILQAAVLSTASGRFAKRVLSKYPLRESKCCVELFTRTVDVKGQRKATSC